MLEASVEVTLGGTVSFVAGVTTIHSPIAHVEQFDTSRHVIT